MSREPEAPAFPGLDEVRNAATFLKPYITRTPVLRFDPPPSWQLDALRSLTFKLELFQVTGTFKARGALLGVGALTSVQKQRGVVAVSRGNHAVAVAYAAKMHGVHAKVVMVQDADPVRVRACEELGAEVVLLPDVAAAFRTFEEIQRNESRASIHPFEGPTPLTGTGTIGLELLEEIPDVDAVLVPVGGGGLIGGIASVVKQVRPRCRVLGIEPCKADSMYRSFLAGAPEKASETSSIADSLAPPFALPYTFEVCRRFVDEIIQVDDDALCRALFLIFRELKLAVEPAAAASVAALLGPLRSTLDGANVAAIICGANISAEHFTSYLMRGAALEGSGG